MLWGKSVGAQQAVRVHWALEADAASGCAALPEVRSQVQRALRRELFVRLERADVILRVRERAHPPSAQIFLEDRAGNSLGQRRLQTATCAELSEGLSLTLSLMLDFTLDEVEIKRQLEREARSDSAAPKPNGAPHTESDPKPAPARRGGPTVASAQDTEDGAQDTERTADSTSDEEPPLTGLPIGLWFDSGVAWGVAPTAAPHLWIGPGIYWGSGVDLEVGAGYRAVFPFRRRGARVVARRWEARIALCHALGQTERTRWRGCLTTQPGWLRAQAEGWPEARTARVLTWHSGVEFAGAWRVSQSARLRLSVGLSSALRGYRFTAHESEALDAERVVLWGPPPVQLQIGIGFVWNAFPHSPPDRAERATKPALRAKPSSVDNFARHLPLNQ